MVRMRLTHFFALVILLAFLAAQSGQSVPVKAAPLLADLRPQAGAAAAGFYNQPTDQMIVKYKDGLETMQAAPDSATQAERLSQAAGVPLAYLRAMSGGAHVMKLAGKRAVAEVVALAQRLMALPEVEYAEPDRILYYTMEPNDPQYTSQWHYAAPVAGSYGINLPAAWDFTTGSASVVVGVIDTGITNHPEFTGRTVPGYDFISNAIVGNDGDGRDADPSDPGDWVTAGQCYSGSPARNSSWHGTHTAGTIGAASNNSAGVTGVNWNSKILPVRVLGRCGGAESDIMDGMRWAAGLPVTGVPANPNPAKVINISLGGIGACSATEQSAINAITAAGTTVVVSAGNASADASGFQPASCSGVITVAATDRYGSMAWYSNFGAKVEIAAPGGDTSYAGGGVLSTVNTGTTVPASPSYAYYQGTSMAAPHVTGVVSLLYSVRSPLTPAQALSYLQNNATHFPTGSSCTTSLCGSGIVNAGAAVVAALPTKTITTITAHTPNPSAMNQAVTVKYTVTPASSSGTPTGTVTVTGEGQSCSGTVAAGQCTITLNVAGSIVLTATYAGDGSYGASISGGVTHTVTGTNHLHIPIIFSPNPRAAYGTVTINGTPAAGETISMNVTADNWTTTPKTYTTTTDANGKYRFTANVPQTLSSTIKYKVYYKNNSDTYNNRLDTWYCTEHSDTTGSDGCDFDIADISYASPAVGATVTLPVNFTWNKRSIATDSYELNFLDLSDRYVCWTGPLGYINKYTITTLSAMTKCNPGRALVSGQPYRWLIWVYGASGYGMAYYWRVVTMTGPAGAPAAEVVTGPLMGTPDRPYGPGMRNGHGE